MKSRIDFFLMAKNLTKSVKNTEIYPSIAPDHNAIYISLSWVNETPRGPGFWKFNNTLLKDENYVATVWETYTNTLRYYEQVSDKRLLWELIKMEIRNTTISYTKHKAKMSRDRAKDIRQQLEQLDEIICKDFFASDINQVLQCYESLKSELQSLYEDKGKHAMFRAKCRWVENGERPTKYFFNLEKKNYNKKTISELRLQDESTTCNEKEILDQIEAYFKILYSSEYTLSQEEYEEFIHSLEIPRLSNEDRDSLEGPLTYEECKIVLDSFQNDKSPGVDGFTVEFYKFFYDLLGNDLLVCLNEGYEKQELTISQRRGIITLLPKDGSLLDLHNWRPITLLNVDSKIAAKAIAKRLETVLPKLIHPDQTGFIKGRYIGENIRLISDILDLTNKQQIPGILVALDFRKAFDSLEWPFIMATLNSFNFGSGIKQWISIFYTNVESAVINNGYSTNWFQPSKGVRQGCPLSPFLFILCAEILSIEIRSDPTVKGINLFGNELKLSQFADDTNLFCADLISVEKAFNIISDFGKMAGLRLNVKKTKAIWLGKWANKKSNPLEIKWMRSPVKILGVHFSYDEKQNNDLNFNLKLRKLQTRLDMWRARDLTLFGRVLIIKSLGLSKIIHSVSNIEAPDGIAGAVRKNLFNFIWKNKKDRIKRTTLYQDLEKGGTRMTALDLMFRSLRLAWIPRLLTAGDCNWCTVPYHFFRKLGGLNFLLRCNYDPKYLPQLPIFYRNILEFFKELKSIYGYDQGSDLVLLNNREILVDNRTVYLNNWVENDVISIKDLLKDDGNYLSFQEFSDKFACKTNFLQYYQIISAIPNHLLLKARQVDLVNKEYFTSNDHFFYLNNNVGIKLDKAKSRDFYQLLIDKTHTGGPHWSQKMERKPVFK